MQVVLAMRVVRVLPVVAGIALGVASGGGGCASAPPAPETRAPSTRERLSLFAYPWMWTDEDGQAVAFSRWRGEPLVLTAIYTRCGATCPRTIGKLKNLEASFRRGGRSAVFLLVTLDPSEDTVPVRKRYKDAQQFPPSWHVLGGDARATGELVDRLGIHLIDDGPHLMHDAKILIFDERGIEAAQFAGWALDTETRFN